MASTVLICCSIVIVSENGGVFVVGKGSGRLFEWLWVEIRRAEGTGAEADVVVLVVIVVEA